MFSAKHDKNTDYIAVDASFRLYEYFDYGTDPKKPKFFTHIHFNDAVRFLKWIVFKQLHKTHV